MNDLYFIDYQPKLILVDTLGLRPDAELAHRRLCDVTWAHGESPLDDDESLADIARVTKDWLRVKADLIGKGWRVENGRFTHKGTVETAQRCAEKYAKKVAASEKGNAARWGKPESNETPLGVRSDVRSESQLQSQSQSYSKLTTKGVKAMSGVGWRLAERLSGILKDQWVNDAGKWVNRIKEDHGKSERVISEVESAIKESRIKKTPAQYAEQIWKEFK